MSPKRYLWLRRMHLVRGLCGSADAEKTTVTEIVTDYGLLELGRLRSPIGHYSEKRPRPHCVDTPKTQNRAKSSSRFGVSSSASRSDGGCGFGSRARAGIFFDEAAEAAVSSSTGQNNLNPVCISLINIGPVGFSWCPVASAEGRDAVERCRHISADPEHVFCRRMQPADRRVRRSVVIRVETMCIELDRCGRIASTRDCGIMRVR